MWVSILGYELLECYKCKDNGLWKVLYDDVMSSLVDLGASSCYMKYSRSWTLWFVT